MFLETITFMGNEILVAISRIKCVYITRKEGWEIHIIEVDDNKFVECFGDDDEKLDKRYEQIKKLLGVASES